MKSFVKKNYKVKQKKLVLMMSRRVVVRLRSGVKEKTGFVIKVELKKFNSLSKLTKKHVCYATVARSDKLLN